jgi:type VI secretion system protein ImpM
MDMVIRLSGWNQTLPNVFWTPQKMALLHLGPPHLGSFKELIAPTATSDHIADLCVPPTMDEVAARRALGPQLDALVSRSELSISSFLDGLG